MQIFALLFSAFLFADEPAAPAITFADDKVGELPPGWAAAHTGKGTGSVWKIVEDRTAPGGRHALAQTSDQGRGAFFNLCVLKDGRWQDVDLTVSFKAVAGKIDQGGGLVWRYQDADNYYVARMNPLEDNFRLYKVVAGKRSQLATADVTAAAGKWHTLRVVHQGKHVRCYLNGKLYLEADDATIPATGQVGLWTKADAQTSFGGLRVATPVGEKK
jgi:hypothetical protein